MNVCMHGVTLMAQSGNTVPTVSYIGAGDAFYIVGYSKDPFAFRFNLVLVPGKRNRLKQSKYRYIQGNKRRLEHT
jgi:hypothetical protein